MLDTYKKFIENGTVHDIQGVATLCRVYSERITDRLKQRFCKDWNIPIKITAEPYFSERLAIYNLYKECVDKYAEFIELVTKLGGEQNYFELYNKTKDKAITYLNENDAMKYFREKEDMSKYKGINGFPTSSIFKRTFIGKTFISIDLRKGNFTALKHYNPDIVGNCSTYEDFMKMFTDESYLRESKYIRQVIFGNVNPKRQVTYEKYLMSLILQDLLLSEVPKETVVFVSADEIVLDADLYTQELIGTINQIVEKHYNEGITTRIEYFSLKYIPETETYCKVFLPYEGKCEVELKCMTHTMMPFVIKALYREKVKSSDLVFELDGQLAKWLTYPKISLKGLPNVKKI